MSRGLTILVSMAVMLLVAGAHAGAGAVPFFAVLCKDGMIALLWVASAGALGAVILRRIRPDAGAAMLVASSAALGLGLMSLGALGLGLADWLNGWTAVGLGLVGPLLLTADVLRHYGNASLEAANRAAEQWLRERCAAAWVWPIVAALAGFALVCAALPPGCLWTALGDPHAYDVVEYHLQMPREWFEAGRISPPLHNVYGFFPFNMEMQYLLAMHLRGGPWKGMYLAHYLALAHMALAVLAVYGAAATMVRRERRGLAGTLAAAAMACTPWVLALGTIAYNEAAMVMYGALAIGWAAAGLGGSGRPVRGMLVGGAMAGLACGSKYTAVPMVLLAVPGAFAVAAMMAWGVARASGLCCSCEPRASGSDSVELSARQDTGCKQPVAPDRSLTLAKQDRSLTVAAQKALPHGRGSDGQHGRDARATGTQVAAGCAAYLLAGLVMLSPWLVRNWRWTGNPVFPEAMPLLGRGHFSEQQVRRWELAHGARAQQAGVRPKLVAMVRQVAIDGRYGYALWPLAVGGLVIAFRRRETRFLGLLLGLMLLFWACFTHLQSRFMILGVPVAAMLAGQLAQWRPGKWVAAPLLLTLAVTSAWVLHPAAWPIIRQFAQSPGAFGVDEFPILADRFEPLAKEDARIALAGDAKAFYYHVPMSRLRYRTVFDLDVREGQSALDAWLGPDAASIRRDSTILIDAAEVNRLADPGTGYWLVPRDPAWGDSGTIIIAPGAK